MSNLDCVLAGLAERIDTLHSASLSSHRKSIEQAIECGRVLAEAKALVAHGQWLPWLEANTKVDPRTASRWMRFAKNADAVLAKSATSADLTFAELDAALCLRDPQVKELRDSINRTVDHQIAIDENDRWRTRQREWRARAETWQAKPESEEVFAEGLALLAEHGSLEAEWFDRSEQFTGCWPQEYVARCRLVADADDPPSVVHAMLANGTWPQLTPDQRADVATKLRATLGDVIRAEMRPT